MSRGHDGPDGRDVTIRAAVSADAAAISRVLAEAFADQRPEFTAEAFMVSTPSPAALVERIAADPVWVGEQGQRVVATVSATPRSPSLWIRSLAVLPEARGRRLAERLLGAAECYAIAHGFGRLELDTTLFQIAAARVYERVGFRPEVRHRVYGTTMIRMTKPLL